MGLGLSGCDGLLLCSEATHPEKGQCVPNEDTDTDTDTDTDAYNCQDATYDGSDISTDPACQFAGEGGNIGNILNWRTGTFTTSPNYSSISMTPILASFTDDNGDGKIDDEDIPDIAATSYWETGGIIRVISGDDGTVIWTQESIDIQPQSGLAAGDIDDDGIIELVAITADDKVAVFEHDGQLKWISGSVSQGISGEYDNPAIANLDGSGNPEITVGSAILDANGSILGIGGEGRGGTTGTASFSADVDGDGHQELVVGNALYDINGQAIWSNGEDDGFPAIADLDQDGDPEIIVSNAGEIRAQDAIQGTVKWKIEVSGAANSGPPTIDDFDGDGEPEIAVITSEKLLVIDGDGTELWSVLNNANPCNSNCDQCDGFTDPSGSLSLSAFDFDGGGVSELVLVDQTRIWIFAGDDGNTKMCSDMHESPTRMEYALVADANGDGQADLIVPSALRDPDDASSSYNQGLKAFGSPSGEWSAGRRIWNQYAYSVTNVNDDGTIPEQPRQSWLTFNTFRSGAIEATTGLVGSDLVGEISDVCIDDCQDDRMVVWAHVGNAGPADILGAVNLTLMAVSPNGEKVALANAVLEGGIKGGRLSESIQIEVNQLDEVDMGSLVLSVDGGSPTASNGTWRECNEDNNEFTYDDRTCAE